MMDMGELGSTGVEDKWNDIALCYNRHILKSLENFEYRVES